MKRRSPTWFFLVLLTVVFGMSLLAPLAWNRARPIPPRDTSMKMGLDGAESHYRAAENAISLPQIPHLEPAIQSPAPPVADLVRAELDAVIAPIVRRSEISVADVAPPQFPNHPTTQAISTESLERLGWMPMPVALLTQLENLAKASACRVWVSQVTDLVTQLVQCDAEDHTRISSLLTALQTEMEAAESLATRIPSERRQSDLRRAAFAVSRRLDLWNGAHELSQAAAVAGQLQRGGDWAQEAAESRRFPRRVANFLTPRSDGRHHDSARGETATPRPPQASAPPEGGGISNASLPGSGGEFLSFISQIERYERTRAAGDAEIVAASLKAMATSQDLQVRQFAGKVLENYRLPNLRIVVTEQLADRVLPQPQPLAREVDDRIQGAQICGQNTIFTTLKARLVPDAQRFHLLLVANGVVDSQTAAYSGPAVFHNEGQTTFEAYGNVKISSGGVKLGEVVAEANATNEVVGVSTDYDRIPLLAPFARSMALKKQSQQEYAALMEVEEKVAEEARRRFQTQLQPKIDEGVRQFQQKLWQPLVRLDLHPTPVEMYTTQHRMGARILIGNSAQLTAHTPRPRAPSDSLASMQIHESLLNNVLEQLKLDGQTLSLPELYRRVGQEITGELPQAPETLPTNVRITFAAKDAVRVRFIGGQVELVLTLDEVRKGQDRWRHLVVKAHYAPEGSGLDARLVRTDYIELAGENLNAGSQIALRGAFSKLLSRSRTVSLVPSRLTDDVRLRDLEVTQFELRDGWIGVAIGPRIGPRTASGQAPPRWRLSLDEEQSTRR